MNSKKYTDSTTKETFNVDVDTTIKNTYEKVKKKIDDRIDFSKKENYKKNVCEKWEWEDFIYKSSSGSNEFSLDIFTEVIDKLKSDGYEMSKRSYLTILFTNLNFIEKRERVRIRDLMNSNRQTSPSDYMKEYIDIYFSTKGDEWIEANKERHQLELKVFDYIGDKIDNDSWLTVYRGFNTKEEEAIRLSNNKNKSDYFRQKEGMGFSYSLSKYVALAFSSRYQIRQMEKFLSDNSEYDFDSNYKEVHKAVTFFRDKHYKNLEYDLELDKLVGRLTLGRYVVHSSKIFSYTNKFNEQEIMCDYRDAKLIDYKFISDNKQFSVDISKIDWDNLTGYFFDSIEQDKTLWINNNWKNDYRVDKSKESLF